MEQNRPEEKTIIEKALSRGQEVSFPVEEAPAKIELSLGGAREINILRGQERNRLSCPYIRLLNCLR